MSAELEEVVWDTEDVSRVLAAGTCESVTELVAVAREEPSEATTLLEVGTVPCELEALLA